MTPEQIVEKILPEKIWTEFGNPVETEWQCKGYNQALSDIRQRLIDTYGKEWVGVPDKWWLKDIITDAWYDQLGSGINRGQSAELIAESILKGLRGK